HRAEWKTSPAKLSRPLMSGSAGSDNAPVALTRTLAVNGPCEVSTTHRHAAVSHAAASSSQSKTNLSRTWYRVAMWRRDCGISQPSENDRDQFGFSANENEYRWDGTSHAAPG